MGNDTSQAALSSVRFQIILTLSLMLICEKLHPMFIEGKQSYITCCFTKLHVSLYSGLLKHLLKQFPFLNSFMVVTS